MSKKQQPFNNPFSSLQLKSKSPEAKHAPSASPSRARSTPTRDDEDAALFLESVGEVAPVRVAKERVAPPAVSPLSRPAEEAESLTRLAELISDDADFTVSSDLERLEGWVRGFDERVMRKLRAGDFTVDAQLDLHGHTQDKARAVVERFIQNARVAGHRCVLLVTGRGLHSEEAPVLKHAARQWLTSGRLARQVLAFSTATPAQGGAGALYVLLRR